MMIEKISLFPALCSAYELTPRELLFTVIIVLLVLTNIDNLVQHSGAPKWLKTVVGVLACIGLLAGLAALITYILIEI